MWHLQFSKKADKQLSKMDPGVRRVIVAWLLKNVDGCEDPRAHGKGLTANKSGKWRYRVGDYRVLCEIRDSQLVVLAIEIGHRREIYGS
ncbi:type II toxin-antitoxin system RelE/ParE family toxin [Eggerthellaceae bacterium zg-887]|uniref:type II toxin-antitoxin system RelE family toxin n=1 Tax=Xiamenia xianingshaonis TaxID=2682776 RepID=UPI0014092BAD|nr:type II toxin-antitoxin system RelE/ParE family toxin [Xiamenia xianingshaonis]NHM16816.1 type II toxin-antitoxin system RelE/ParE family toxin [Xiamenia xianingshaonis]